MSVKITLKDGFLKIEGDANDTFFSDRNENYFLNGWEFFSGKKGGKISWTGTIDKKDEREIINYLEGEGLKFKADSNLAQKISKKKEDEARYKKITVKGTKIKTTTSRFRAKGAARGFELKKFQKRPVEHGVRILSEGGYGIANFSVPGAGKTVMTYAVYNELKRRGVVDQLWVIGPLPSFKPWEDEYKVIFGKKLDIEKHIIRYDAKAGGSAAKRKGHVVKNLGKFDVVLTSFSIAASDRVQIENSWKSSGKKIFLVVDESHHIMSFNEITESDNDTSAVAITKLGESAERRCILSGTPMPHDWNNLYSQFKFLYPGREVFGDRDEYEQLTHDEINQTITGIWDRVSFNQLKKELPKILPIKTIPVPMNDLQEEVYEMIVEQMENMDEGTDRWLIEGWKEAKVVRTLQASSNPQLILENDETFNAIKFNPKAKENVEITKKIIEMSKQPKNTTTPKLKKACEIAEGLATCTGEYKSKDRKKKNVVIYTVFRGNARIIAEGDERNPAFLEHLKPVYISGELDYKEREKRINEFKNWNPNKEKNGKILVATVASIAESVSLHKNEKNESVCQHAIYLERDYNAGQYMQSKYRIYRIGSDKRKPIQYYILQSEFKDGRNTLDHHVDIIVGGREAALHGLLNDPMRLETLHMEVDTYKNKRGVKVPWGPEDSISSIVQRAKNKRRKK